MIKNKEKNQRFFGPSIFPKSRKAQISEGLTWVAATIAIIIILLISVVITSTAFDLNDREIIPESFTATLNQKSLMSYLLTREPGGETVYSAIKKDENLNDFNGNLAVKVFKGLYEKEYSGIWVGVSDLGFNIIGGRIGNDFFARISLIGSEAYSTMIKFAQEKAVEAVFVK